MNSTAFLENVSAMSASDQRAAFPPFIPPIRGIPRYERFRIAATDGVVEPDRVGRVISDDVVILDVDAWHAIARRRQNECVIETNFKRPRLDGTVVVRRSLSETQMPFADDSGRIAGLLEDRRHRGRSRGDAQRRDAAQDAGPGRLTPGISTGHEGVACWRAHCGRRMGVGESHPFLRQPIHVRRLDLRRTIAAEIAIADVVAENEDDVGRGGRLAGHGHHRMRDDQAQDEK